MSDPNQLGFVDPAPTPSPTPDPEPVEEKGPNGRQVNPVFEALVDLFGITRPKPGQRWGATAKSIGTAAAEISRIDGPPSETEIHRRATEYRRRFPTAKLTPTAFAKHWYDLSGTQNALVGPQERKRVSVSYTNWKPTWPSHVGQPISLPAVPAPPVEGEEFSRDDWFRQTIFEQRRATAVKSLHDTFPVWAAQITPASIRQADPPHHEDLLACIKAWVAAPSALCVLYGPVGGGKTILATAMAWRLADRGIAPLFFRHSDLMSQLRSEFGRRSDAGDVSVMDRAAQAGLLVLDDYGAGREARDWEDHAVDALLNKRIDSGKPTILTTNLRGDDDGPGSLLAEVGDRFASRFAAGAMLAVPGPDRRVVAMLAASAPPAEEPAA